MSEVPESAKELCWIEPPDPRFPLDPRLIWRSPARELAVGQLRARVIAATVLVVVAGLGALRNRSLTLYKWLGLVAFWSFFVFGLPYVHYLVGVASRLIQLVYRPVVRVTASSVQLPSRTILFADVIGPMKLVEGQRDRELLIDHGGTRITVRLPTTLDVLALEELLQAGGKRLER